MQKPKAIIFDVGNTLLKEISYDLDKGLSLTLNELRIDSKNECLTIPHNLQKIIKDSYSGNHNEFILIDWLKKVLTDCNINLTFRDIERIVWDNTVLLKPYPDLNLVLAQLKQQGIRLAALSNTVFTSNAMKYEFSKHNILDYFEFIITSADIGIRKPAEQIFLKAIETINLHQSDIWFVGDSWEDDILGADAVGLRPVWKCESNKLQNCGHLFFQDWHDFNKFIKD